MKMNLWCILSCICNVFSSIFVSFNLQYMILEQYWTKSAEFCDNRTLGFSSPDPRKQTALAMTLSFLFQMLRHRKRWSKCFVLQGLLLLLSLTCPLFPPPWAPWRNLLFSTARQRLCDLAFLQLYVTSFTFVSIFCIVFVVCNSVHLLIFNCIYKYTKLQSASVTWHFHNFTWLGSRK